MSNELIEISYPSGLAGHRQCANLVSSPNALKVLTIKNITESPINITSYSAAFASGYNTKTKYEVGKSYISGENSPIPLRLYYCIGHSGDGTTENVGNLNKCECADQPAKVYGQEWWNLPADQAAGYTCTFDFSSSPILLQEGQSVSLFVSCPTDANGDKQCAYHVLLHRSYFGSSNNEAQATKNYSVGSELANFAVTFDANGGNLILRNGSELNRYTFPDAEYGSQIKTAFDTLDEQFDVKREIKYDGNTTATYKLTGWKNSSGVTIDTESAEALTHAETFYAQWSLQSCTVLFQSGMNTKLGDTTIAPFSGAVPDYTLDFYPNGVNEDPVYPTFYEILKRNNFPEFPAKSYSEADSPNPYPIEFSGWYYYTGETYGDTGAPEYLHITDYLDGNHHSSYKITPEMMNPSTGRILFLARGTAATPRITIDYNYDGCPDSVTKYMRIPTVGEESTTIPKYKDAIEVDLSEYSDYNGHVFFRWATRPYGGDNVDPEAYISNPYDHTIYAQWAQNSYPVTFDANGGSCDTSSKDVLHGEVIGSLPQPSKSGYTFVGWYSSPEGGSAIDGSTEVYTNMKLYAHWEANTYTAVFNYMYSHSGARKSVRYDDVWGELAAYSYGNDIIDEAGNLGRYGYTLKGWRLNTWKDAQGNDNKVIEPSGTITITEDCVLIADASANKYTVSFESLGDSTVTAQTVTYGKVYGTLPTPIRSGYTFDGWYLGTKEENGSITYGNRVYSHTVYAPSTPFTKTADGSIVDSGNGAKDHTLYAKWAPNRYVVGFNLNGGTSTTYPSKHVYYNSAYFEEGQYDQYTPTRAGYVFDGWKDTDKNEISDKSTVARAEDHHLYAQWEPNEYTVSFDAFGGTLPNTSNSLKVIYASAYGTLPEPSRTGYRFGGWYTAPAGVGTKIEASTSVTIAANHTLYPLWIATDINVKFNPNSGALSPTTRSVKYGATYGTLPTPEYAGHTFKGWYTFDGAQVTASSVVTDSSDHTLYAEWEANTYTLFLHVEGQDDVSISALASQTYRAAGVPDPSNYSRTGYRAGNWYEQGSKNPLNVDATIAGDKCLHLSWIPLSYKVDFVANGGTWTELGGNSTGYLTLDITYGDTYSSAFNTVASQKLARLGYVFVGWFTKNGTNSSDWGTEIIETSIVSTTTHDKLYARWERTSTVHRWNGYQWEPISIPQTYNNASWNPVGEDK